MGQPGLDKGLQGAHEYDEAAEQDEAGRQAALARADASPFRLCRRPPPPARLQLSPHYTSLAQPLLLSSTL